MNKFLLAVILTLFASPVFAAIARVQGSGFAVRPGAGSFAFSTTGNVTNANVVIVAVTVFDNGGNPGTTTLAKSAGTSTIGTVVTDISYSATYVAGVKMYIFRVPITGTGSLTLTLTNSVGTDGFWTGGWEEYSYLTSFSLDGSTTANHATGTSGSTNSVTSTAATGGGVITALISEAATVNGFARTFSDNAIFHSEDTSKVTGIDEDKLVSSGSFTITSGFAGNSWAWDAIAQAYKDATSSGGAVSCKNILGSGFICDE